MWWVFLLIALASLTALAVLLINIDIIFFKRKVNKEILKLGAENSAGKDEIISGEDLKNLPEPMQRYLEYAQIIGKKKINQVKLRQKGFIKQTPEKSWMPFKAKQFFTINPPGFLWTASMRMLPGLSIKARDMYLAGQGNMYIKLPPFVTIADARGCEMNQGTALRYLAEMVWFPTAFISEYIRWEPVDANSCIAILDYRGMTVRATLHFNQMGEMTGLNARRYREESGRYVLTEWTPKMWEYKELHGIKIPTRVDIVWKLKSGDFPCIRLEVTEVEYSNSLSQW